MEIGTKPIAISVLTAVTNSALNAASVFPSRKIEISDSHTDLNRSADINIQVIDAALQDFEVSPDHRRLEDRLQHQQTALEPQRAQASYVWRGGPNLKISTGMSCPFSKPHPRQEPWWFPPNERLESPSLLEWMKF
jgi:hypothetical protein